MCFSNKLICQLFLTINTSHDIHEEALSPFGATPDHIFKERDTMSTATHVTPPAPQDYLKPFVLAVHDLPEDTEAFEVPDGLTFAEALARLENRHLSSRANLEAWVARPPIPFQRGPLG